MRLASKDRGGSSAPYPPRANTDGSIDGLERSVSWFAAAPAVALTKRLRAGTLGVAQTRPFVVAGLVIDVAGAFHCRIPSFFAWIFGLLASFVCSSLLGERVGRVMIVVTAGGGGVYWSYPQLQP